MFKATTQMAGVKRACHVDYITTRQITNGVENCCHNIVMSKGEYILVSYKYSSYWDIYYKLTVTAEMRVGHGAPWG